MRHYIIKNHCISLLIFSIVVLILVGCQNTEARDSNATSTNTIAEQTVSENATQHQVSDTDHTASTIEPEMSPPTDLVAEDLLYLDCNYFSLNGIDTYLEINTLQLEHARHDVLFDVLRYSVEYGNEFYEVDAVYDLSYSYNGEYWSLVNYDLVSSNSRAIKSQIDPSKLIQNCEKHFDSYQITEQTYCIDDNGVFTDIISFQGTIESKYFTETFDGTYKYIFENDYWHEDWDIVSREIDWSLVEGTWTLEHYDECITINIESIVQKDNKIDVTYTYKTSSWYDDGPWNGYFKSNCTGASKPETRMQRTCELDLYSSDFCTGSKYKHTDTYAFTLPIEVGGWKSEWEEGYFTLFFDSNEGFCIHGFKYLYKNPNYSKNSWEWRSDANETTVYFEKVIDWDSVQEAIDKLKEMNS